MRMKQDNDLVGRHKSPEDGPPISDFDSLSLRSGITSIESLSDPDDQKQMNEIKWEARSAKQEKKKEAKQENQIQRLARRLDVLQSILENRTGKPI